MWRRCVGHGGLEKRKMGGKLGGEASKSMGMMDEGTTKYVPALFQFSHSSCWLRGSRESLTGPPTPSGASSTLIFMVSTVV